MSLQSINFTKLRENAKAPIRAHDSDAGADLCVAFPEGSEHKVVLKPMERKLLPTGIAVEIPVGYVGLGHPRSGLAHKNGISIVNAPGTIDSGYRGEIMVNVINLSNEDFIIEDGMRIAQLVIQQVELPVFREVSAEELTDSERGKGGHGSTGVH